MASIQEDVSKQAWELFLKFFGTGAEFVYNIAHETNTFIKQNNDIVREFLTALFNKQKENGEVTDAVTQMLHRQEKGETINMMQIADEDAPELSKRFAENKILFTTIESVLDDTKVLLYMSGDAEKILSVIDSFQADKGLISELSPDIFTTYYAKEGIGSISGLDKADVEMFRKFAKEKKLVFAVADTDIDGMYEIIYNTKDRMLVREVMDATVWAFSGELGADIKNRISDLVRNRDKIISAFVNNSKSFYIVNAKNPEHYLHITEDELVYFKDGNEITRVDRGRADFLDRALQYIDGMEIPLLVKKEEFEVKNALGESNKEAFANLVKQKAKKIPDKEKLEKDQAEHNKQLELIQSKMALDDENTAGFWIYDNDIDFAEGGVYELKEDTDEQIKTDIMDARKRAARYRFKEILAEDERSVDKKISDAEKQRGEVVQEHQQLEREK